MTKFKPILQVRRLRVERLNKKVYDEKYHKGVNIIRGDNSSGKSTILNLLYYGIGGDINDWSPTALLCTRVLVEVSLNGYIATFSREISDKAGQAMDVFGGPLDEALNASSSNWSRYPYRRSETKESFSQTIFRLLDIPEATTETSGNVTVHQMLRLMYADQLSPVGTLFKFEQFDPPLLRDSVGRLIFGAYENELYANELKIKEFSKEFAEVSAELKAISNLVRQTEQVLTPSWLAAERSRVEEEKASLDSRISAAEQSLYEASSDQSLSLENQRLSYQEVQSIQGEIRTQSEAIDACKFEIADAAEFIKDLESKLESLSDASTTSDAFGKISFQYCPACYSAVEIEHPAHACHLCKSPFDSERARLRIASLINDTSKQLRQSRSIQKDRAIEVKQMEVRLKDLNYKWKAASEKLARSVNTPSSAARQELRILQRAAGYIDRQLEDLEAKSKLSAAFEGLVSRKSHLQSQITTLNERNEILKSAVDKRLQVAYSEVQGRILSLLHKDLPREEAFIDAKTVQFDFASNKLSVDNQSYFSASSRVILRNSFFVGLFSAATRDMSFRHFRLCILDSIEDKGMQPDRSHNFQRMIINASQESISEHQIIFATSMIAPELDIDTLTIGHYSTLENHTLEIKASKIAPLL